MFSIFRSFYTKNRISGMLHVTMDASGYVIPCAANGNCIGSVEPFAGNIDLQFDISTNAALPVNIRLFSPTRFGAATGIGTTGFSAGALLYLAGSGFVSPTGTVIAGLALNALPPGNNGGRVEIAEIINTTTGGSSPTLDVVESGNFTLTKEVVTQVNTTGGASIAQTPVAPVIGDWFGAEDAEYSFDAHNLTIHYNGTDKINGGTSDYVASVVGNKLRGSYISSGYGWSIK